MRKIDFGMFRMFCIFVMSNITQWRGDLPIRAGIFIPVTLHIRRFRTPVESVNAPHTPLVLSNGTGGTVFFLPPLTQHIMDNLPPNLSHHLLMFRKGTSHFIIIKN